MMSRFLQSPHWWERLGWLVGVTVATVLVMGLGGNLSNLPDGYLGVQDDSASALAALPEAEWGTLRAAAARDVFIFVPTYLAWGLFVAWMIAAAKSSDAANPRHSGGRLARAPRTLAITVVVTAVADWIETGLFYMSLTRLDDGRGEDSIELLTRVTPPFTGLKFVAGGAALVLLVFQVLTRPAPTHGADIRV